jgi:hypothetical protein
MKKALAILLAFTLLLALAACGGAESDPAPETEAPAAPETPPETAAPAEEADGDPAGDETGEDFPEDDGSGEDLEDFSRTEEALTGLWYCQIEGVDLSLELRADGAYTMSLPAAPEETIFGVWRLEDGFIWLDDSEQPLSVMGDSLYWHAVDAYATREEPAPIYRAAETVEAPAGAMDGYWVALFLEVDGQVFSTELLGEELDLYLEGQRGALGGFFGDQIVDLEETDGVLRFAGEGFRADLALQTDGFLRLTLATEGEGELYYYLLPVSLNNAVDTDA